MKKLLALLLAAAICLSLVACGVAETPNTDDTDANNTSQETENSTTDNTDYASELTQLLCENNVWYGMCHGEGNEEEFTFFEDGHFEKNGSSFTWTLNKYLPDASEFLASSAFQTTPNYDAARGLYVTDEFLLGYDTDGNLLLYWRDYFCYNESNTPNIVEIELTAENFDTYFEIAEVPIFSKNEFGETDEMELYQYYLVREEYNVSDMTDFAIEYSCVWGRKDCEVDFTNLTYTLSDFKDTTPPANVMTDRFYDIEVNGQGRFGFSIDGSGKSVKKSYGSIGEVGYSVDFEILRVKGTLFLIEE